MPSRILIAYDGSELARRAILAAAQLLPGAEACVVHVAAPVTFAPSDVPLAGSPVPAVDPSHHIEETQSQVIAEEGAREATQAGFEATAHTALADHGGVPEAVVAAAVEQGAALIVVGSHGHGALRSALLGSVSAGVVKESRLPVLVVPVHD